MNNETKRYYVDFYDMIDGWGDFGFFPERLFDDLNLAIGLCNKLNSELDKPNKECGEHYGVIDRTVGREIYCGMDEKYRSDLLKTINTMLEPEGIKDIIKGQDIIKGKDIKDIDWKALGDHWAKEYTEDYAPKK